MGGLYTNEQLARLYVGEAPSSRDEVSRTYQRIGRIIEEAKESIHEFYIENRGSLKELSIPGIGLKVKRVLEEILGMAEVDYFFGF